MDRPSPLLTPEKVNTQELIERLDTHAAGLIRLIARHPEHEIRLRRLAADVDEVRLQLGLEAGLIQSTTRPASRECGGPGTPHADPELSTVAPAGGRTTAQAPFANPPSHLCKSARPGESAPGRLAARPRAAEPLLAIGQGDFARQIAGSQRTGRLIDIRA